MASPSSVPTAPRSPFVTPNHPLYVFGDRDVEPKTPIAATQTAILSTPVAPLRNYGGDERRRELLYLEGEVWRKRHVGCHDHKRHMNCLDSMMGMSLSSKTPLEPQQQQEPQQHQETPSPRDVFSPPTWSSATPLTPIRSLRRSDAFDDEGDDVLWGGSDEDEQMKPAATNNLFLIGDDLDDIDGESLTRRLCRMKRRLFLERVASTSPSSVSPSAPAQHPEKTPKHSNQSKNNCHQLPSFLATESFDADESMEGMEVVLQELPTDDDSATTTAPSSYNRHLYPFNINDSEESLFHILGSTSSIDNEPKLYRELIRKRLSSASIATDATAASTAIGDSYDDHLVDANPH